MLHNTSIQTLGADLRALRKSRNMTLAELSGALNKSVGWLSQVERNISKPSIDELRDLAKELNVPISILFGQSDGPKQEAGRIVRKGQRRAIGSSEALVEELLSPDLTDDFEMVHSTFQPGAKLDEAVCRPTQEVGFVISGQLELWVGEDKFTVGPGDSFRIRNEAFRWANPYDDPAVLVWVIAPPVY